VAQGAKTGWRCQLPGGKSKRSWIARLRYAVPSVTLISQPPQSWWFNSIEDLAQLILILKQLTRKALNFCEKLVSLKPGVGTIAAGVGQPTRIWITISVIDGGYCRVRRSPRFVMRVQPWERNWVGPKRSKHFRSNDPSRHRSLAKPTGSKNRSRCGESCHSWKRKVLVSVADRQWLPWGVNIYEFVQT